MPEIMEKAKAKGVEPWRHAAKKNRSRRASGRGGGGAQSRGDRAAHRLRDLLQVRGGSPAFMHFPASAASALCAPSVLGTDRTGRSRRPRSPAASPRVAGPERRAVSCTVRGPGPSASNCAGPAGVSLRVRAYASASAEASWVWASRRGARRVWEDCFSVSKVARKKANKDKGQTWQGAVFGISSISFRVAKSLCLARNLGVGSVFSFRQGLDCGPESNALNSATIARSSPSRKKPKEAERS